MQYIIFALEIWNIQRIEIVVIYNVNKTIKDIT